MVTALICTRTHNLDNDKWNSVMRTLSNVWLNSSTVYHYRGVCFLTPYANNEFWHAFYKLLINCIRYVGTRLPYTYIIGYNYVGNDEGVAQNDLKPIQSQELRLTVSPVYKFGDMLTWYMKK